MAVLLLSLVSPLLLSNCSRVNQSYLMRNFSAHRQSLEQLVRMAKTETNVRFIGLNSVNGAQLERYPVANIRWQQYKDLMRTANIWGIRRDNNGSIRLFVWASGPLVGDVATGYAYFDYTPTPLLKDIGYFKESGEAYQHVRGHWYLFVSN